MALLVRPYVVYVMTQRRRAVRVRIRRRKCRRASWSRRTSPGGHRPSRRHRPRRTRRWRKSQQTSWSRRRSLSSRRPEQSQAESAPRDISAQPPVPPPSPGAPPGALGVNHPNTWVLNRALDTYRDAMASFVVEEFARHGVAAAGAISAALDRSLRREYRERMADVARPRDAIRIMYVPSVVRYWWSRYFADHFDGDRGVLSLLEQIAEASERARSAGDDDLPADDVARDIGLVSDLFERLGQPDLAAEMNDLRSQLREGPSTQAARSESRLPRDRGRPRHSRNPRGVWPSGRKRPGRAAPSRTGVTGRG